MSTPTPVPPLLDFGALIAPIPGEDPAGQPLPFAVRQQLEQGRQEVDDSTLPPEDQKKADWPLVVRVAREALQTTAKDLLVAARLTEGLVKLHGFTGARDGLGLLRRLVDECWERLRPPLDDEPEARAAPFHWLDVPDKSARFPATLRAVPLVVGPSGSYGWQDWQDSLKGKGPVSREEFEGAAAAAPWGAVAGAAQDIGDSLTELQALADGLTARMGPAAPGLTGIRQALEDCHALATQILLRKRPEAGPDGDIPGDQPGEPAPAAAASCPAAGRAEAYRQLARAAAVLRELEPHSPVPHLVQWAVQLGDMPFPQLMRELIRNGDVLKDLARVLGIKELGQTEGAEPGA